MPEKVAIDNVNEDHDLFCSVAETEWSLCGYSK